MINMIKKIENRADRFRPLPTPMRTSSMARSQRRSPPFLRPGDAVGFAAPASPFDIFDLAAGLPIFRRFGLRPVVPMEIFNRNGYLAGTDPGRIEVLHRLFEDPDIRGIVCVRGGFGSMRILEGLNWALIEKNPKPFVGFSDVTALLNALYHRCGMRTYHGPMAASMSRVSPDSVTACFSAIMGRELMAIRPDAGRVIRAGKVTGPLVGGNLSILSHMIGTPFSPSFDGHILFLEDRGEAVYRIDRMLTQFRLAGSLDGILGVVLGQFSECGDARQCEVVFQHAFGSLGVPVMAGFPIGHGRENHTLPIGGMATLDTERGGLFFNG